MSIPSQLLARFVRGARHVTMALALSGVCAPLSESRAASAQDSLPHAPVEGAPVGPGYVLGPGDRLQVFVSTLADTSRVVTLDRDGRSEEHTSELQSPTTISYAVFCL